MARRATRQGTTRRRPARKSTGRRAKATRRAPKKPRRSFLLWATKWSIVLAIWGAVVGGAVLLWFSWGLPDIDRLAAQERRPGIVLNAGDGSRLASFGDNYGVRRDIKELPVHVPQAVVAIEDRRFYQHPGVDLRGVARAAYTNLARGRLAQGGSTLTQQLAKNLFLTPERTFSRKIRELILAWRLERRFTKDELLTIYLNQVYMGAGTYGVEAAAQRYFGRSARDLSVYQSAVLAGLLRAPSRWNPATDPQAAHRRAQTVLAAMVDAGFVSRGDADAAVAAAVPGTAGTTATSGALYFADWVLPRLAGFAGLSGGDVVVETTLDPALQALAERVVAAAPRPDGAQVALVAMTPDGAVRAMVGGVDYADSQFNRAAQALRQPGSAFKPFVYLAALEDGATPQSQYLDAPIAVGDWSPRNAGDRYLGTVSLRDALAQSLNSVAVRTIEQVGPRAAADVARRVGIASDLSINPSLALGTSEVTPLELTAAYAVFANAGNGVLPHGVREIRDPRATVLYRRDGGGPGRAVAPEHVATMHTLLASVITDGTGRAARLDRPAAGKTGTSQDSRDAWFVGYTADLVAGVWVGHDDARPMADGTTGGGVPARIWQAFMAQAHAGLPPRPLPGP